MDYENNLPRYKKNSRYINYEYHAVLSIRYILLYYYYTIIDQIINILITVLHYDDIYPRTNVKRLRHLLILAQKEAGHITLLYTPIMYLNNVFRKITQATEQTRFRRYYSVNKLLITINDLSKILSIVATDYNYDISSIITTLSNLYSDIFVNLQKYITINNNVFIPQGKSIYWYKNNDLISHLYGKIITPVEGVHTGKKFTILYLMTNFLQCKEVDNDDLESAVKLIVNSTNIKWT